MTKGERQLRAPRTEIDFIDQVIWKFEAERVREIGRVAILKRKNNQDIHQPNREEVVIANARKHAILRGIDPDYAERSQRLRHNYGVEVQGAFFVAIDEGKSIAEAFPVLFSPK